MKVKTLFSLIAGVLVLNACSVTPEPPTALNPVPTERQMAWHERGCVAFVHFTTNTFTDKEWGYGDEKPEVFNPTSFDAEQWVKALKDGGLQEVILTCKHHDGFCLWPSKYTEHSVAHSPWMDGKGDVVKAVSDACRKYGLKFGIYLSPWDRNQATYGTPEYIKYYRNQLRELLSNYGEVSEVWFDGANGGDGYYGGAREKRKIDNTTYYDWPNTCKIVRELAPNAVMFSDGGPDIRWCGNEAGWVGDPNWNTITLDTIYAGKPNISDLLSHGVPGGKDWCPAEVDVSIRPGWFYHASEDDRVKTPQTLMKMYLESVGRGAVLLLNVPPDRRGLLNEKDVQSLKEWKELLDKTFATNLAKQATARADSYRGKATAFAPQNVLDGKADTYWATDDDVKQGCLEIDFGKTVTLQYVLIQEYVQLGQRIKAFTVEAKQGDDWMPIGTGSTVGFKRILPVEATETEAIRIRFTDSLACPVISNVEVY